MGSKFRFCNLQVIWTYFIRSVISYPRMFLHRAQNALLWQLINRWNPNVNSCGVAKSGCDKSKGMLIRFSEFCHFSENKQVILDQIWLWQINLVYVFLLKQFLSLGYTALCWLLLMLLFVLPLLRSCCLLRMN